MRHHRLGCLRLPIAGAAPVTSEIVDAPARVGQRALIVVLLPARATPSAHPPPACRRRPDQRSAAGPLTCKAACEKFPTPSPPIANRAMLALTRSPRGRE